MRNQSLALLVSSLAVGVLVLAGCAGAPTATPVLSPTKVPPVASAAASNSAATNSQPAGAGFPVRSSEGGSVTVAVKPTALAVGEPVAFDIAMNTHSVDLGDDLTKIALLRDDSGKEYKPTAWEGPEGGGHHRSGTLKFPALAGKPKSIELVITGLAQVPERDFKWDLP